MAPPYRPYLRMPVQPACSTVPPPVSPVSPGGGVTAVRRGCRQQASFQNGSVRPTSAYANGCRYGNAEATKITLDEATDLRPSAEAGCSRRTVRTAAGVASQTAGRAAQAAPSPARGSAQLPRTPVAQRRGFSCRATELLAFCRHAAMTAQHAPARRSEWQCARWRYQRQFQRVYGRLQRCPAHPQATSRRRRARAACRCCRQPRVYARCYAPCRSQRT